MRYRDLDARGEFLPWKPLLEKGSEIRYLPQRFFFLISLTLLFLASQSAKGR